MLNEYYLWIKLVHYFGFISWMAGLFYLPRLFVYHAENAQNSAFVSIVKTQERKLFYGIQTPAMIITLISGILMLISNTALLKSGGYMHLKLSCAFLLLLFHFHNWFCLRALARDKSKKSGKFFRIYNEIPTILMMIIVAMMILRPF